MIGNQLVQIDGSLGEGGGQILRTSLSMSVISGSGFHISNIRSTRKKPGLMPQHLVAVDAAAEISAARVEGASLHSTELSFIPTRNKSGLPVQHPDGRFCFLVYRPSSCLCPGPAALQLSTAVDLMFHGAPASITCSCSGCLTC
jgi:RNA 3'-terminal phosphate cyclase (ATP)